MLPLLFTVTNEGASPYLEANTAAAGLGLAATFARERGALAAGS
jgi:hypothetical protein